MSAREPERKVVSVLFVDLVGFTPLSERLDAEDVATIQGAYFDAVRTVVSRHGGIVEKYIGDAVMALFGVPRVREDDAARAIAAGLALTGAVDGISRALGLDEGELRIRVAVNSGEVVQGADPSPESALVTGDVVNVAARLQGEAEPGRVVVGPLTAILAADSVELEAPWHVTLKGKTEPLTVAHARAMRPERSREEAMGSLRAPLIGRDHEIATLAAAATAALDGTGALVAVVAPPGSGKSRLLRELATSRGALQPVLQAAVRPDALRPFDPVSQLMAAALGHVGVAADEDEDRLIAAVTRVLEPSGGASGRSRVLAAEIDVLMHPDRDPAAAAESDRDRRFGNWIDALSALCPHSVWLLDDVHWAAADLRAFILAAGGTTPGPLIVAAARPSLLADHADWSRQARVIELAPLGQVSAARLARSLVGDAIPAALSDRIAEASDGNPLFIEELLRSWAGSGLLVEGAGGWRLLAEPDAIDLPVGIRSVYGGQLDDLPDAARALARRAAVAGRRFPVGTLAALEITAPDDALATMERRGLISGPADDPVVGPTYTFRHALLRETAYGTVARAERARRHVALARWFAERERGNGETAELAGRHYEAALREAPALGREVAPGTSREAARVSAAEWYEQAALAAAMGTAHETAAGLLRRALGLTDPDEFGDRARRLRLLGLSLTSAGDMSDAGEALAEALALLDSMEKLDRTEYAAAAAALARVRYQQIRFRESADLAARARERVGDGDDVETAALMLAQGLAEIAETDDRSWTRLLERALEIARSRGDRVLELRTLEAVLADRPSEAAEGVAAWEQVELLARELGRPESQLSAMQSVAYVRRMGGGAPDLDAFRPAVDLAEAYGLREERAWLDYVQAEIALLDDHQTEALRLALAAIATGQANGYFRLVVRSWFVALPILAEGRRDGEALHQAREFFDEFERTGVPSSPYARIMVPAAWLNLAAAGAAETPPPTPRERMDSFLLAYGDPSWTLAVETVLGSWIAAGWLSAVEEALVHLGRALESPDATFLARSSFHLLEARLKAARGEPADVIREQTGLAVTAARRATAPRWEQAALSIAMNR